MEGIARYIYETTKQMVLDHPEDTFHFIFDRPYDKQFIFAKNVIPHVIYPPARHPILWYLWFEWSIPALLKKIKPDVFYSGDMYMSLKTTVPTIMVSHDINYEHYPENLPYLTRKFLLHYSKKYHEKSVHLITVSNATKNDLVETYQLAEEKITVAYNSAPSGFKPLSLEEKTAIQIQFSQGKPYFVYVGSIHPRKNVTRLIKAFDKFKSNNSCEHKLLIYGRVAWKTSSLFKVYESLTNKADIVFVDNDSINVPSIMGAAEALVYVSIFEGFGIPILEAFDCEIPVITSNTSSMPEVAGDAAILVDPRNLDSIASAFFTIINNEEKRTALIQSSKIQRKKFSWVRSAKTIYNKLEEFHKPINTS